MYYLHGDIVISGAIVWQYSGKNVRGTDEGLRISFNFHSWKRQNRRAVMQSAEKAILSNELRWIVKQSKVWVIDLDAVKEAFTGLDELKELEWFNGAVVVEPEFECDEGDSFGRRSDSSYKVYKSSVCFYITPELKEDDAHMVLEDKIPTEILESVNNFRQDYPITSKTAFIMMRFSSTPNHNAIVTEIKRILLKHDIIGLRADDKEYSDDLFSNIRTYMHCCNFGIAVFERLLDDTFNPNVSLEVGYMMGINKSVCLLKDSTLPSLTSDLVGKLYKSFDTQRIGETLEAELEKWLRDRGFI